MNMKKTMAAIAAGAVAVSAMATTVSALDAKTLTYNLVEAVKSETKIGTVTSFYSDVEILAGDQVRITTVGSTTGGSIVTISGSYYDDQGNSTKTINPTVFTNRDWETVWNPEGDACCNWSDTVTIPVVAQKAGTAVALVASSRANIQVKVDYKDLPGSITWDGALTAEIKGGLRGIKLEVWRRGDGTAATTEDEWTTVAVATGNANVDASGATIKTVGTKKYTYKAGTDATATASAGLTVDVTEYKGGDMNLTYQVVNQADVDAGAAEVTGWVNDATGDVVSPATLGIDITGTPVKAASATKGTAASAIVISTDANGMVTAIDKTGYAGATLKAGDQLDAAADGSGQVPAGLTNLVGATFTYNSTADAFVGTGSDGNQAVIAKATVGGTPSAGTNGTNATGGSTIKITGAKDAAWDIDPATDGIKVTGQVEGEVVIATTKKETKEKDPAVAGAFAKVWPAGATPITGTASGVGDATTTKQFPYYSYLGASYIKGDDVISNITKSDGTPTSVEEYNAIKAVINDAVVNYADVTFVFNTATKNIKFEWDATNTAKEDSWGFYTDDGATNGKVTSYTDSSKAHISGYYQVVDYKSFGRHYWDTEMGYDPNTIYINNDWLGNNLFEGALVINDGITLSLAATDKFDWTGTSLSFSWDAIQDTALTQNQYANYIHNMVLKTSTTWYWDNFQVVLGATEDEDVGTTSPVEAEEEELEETEDEPEVEYEPEDEPEEEPADEPEDEPVEVTPAANPGTGNAPVALAVIPVALAAAAIVAKKRG